MGVCHPLSPIVQCIKAYTNSVIRNATAKTGNTINPSKTQSEPKIKLLDTVPNTWSKSKTKSPQLTLAMTDPDAPSRDNPEWSEICHWIATDFHLTDSEEDLKRHEGHDEPAGDSADTVSKKDIKPYKPPGPPPKTGKHRYVFVALAPKNGTTAKLHLRKPGDRQHWGFKHEREGLRMWAEEMGLGVVGERIQILDFEA